jgi:hypothetical protein
MPKKDRHRANGELFSLDIPSYRTFPVSVNQELAGEKSCLPENLDGEASSRRALNKTTNTTNTNYDPAMEYVVLVTLDMDRTRNYKCTLTTASLSTRVGKKRRRM